MKVEVKDNIFYLVEVGESKWVHNDRDEGVETMKEEVAENPELDRKDVGIFEVDTSEKKWNIKQIPWAEIAMELIRGEKGES